MISRTEEPQLLGHASSESHSADGLGEAVRGLLCRLPWPLGDANPGHRVLGLTSCSVDAGVTTVAVQLAIEAANMVHGPVLLVDANFARPEVHKRLRVRAGLGLAEALRLGIPLSKLVQRSQAARVSVLAAGLWDGDEDSGVDSPGIAGLVDVLRDEFALVVFDLPLADELGQSANFVRFLDGLVLVVEAERTFMETVRRAKYRFENQTTVLGVVMNKRRSHTPAWLDRIL